MARQKISNKMNVFILRPRVATRKKKSYSLITRGKLPMLVRIKIATQFKPSYMFTKKDGKAQEQ